MYLSNLENTYEAFILYIVLNTFNQYTCYGVCMYNVIMTFFKMLIVSINNQENRLLYKALTEVSAVFNLYKDHFHLIQLELFKLHEMY